MRAYEAVCNAAQKLFLVSFTTHTEVESFTMLGQMQVNVAGRVRLQQSVMIGPLGAC